MKLCEVCGNKVNILSLKKAYDGIICPECSELTTRYKSETINNLKEYYLINSKRKEVFKPNKKLKGFASVTVLIDDNNELFTLGGGPIYKFNEVSNYYVQSVSGPKVITTKTKNSGGITRAIVGGMIAGPVGALVGAGTSKSVSTSKDTTKVEIKHYLEINTYSGFCKWELVPPKGFDEFATYCMNNYKKTIKENENNDLDSDDINMLIKYKKLLENGIITQDEFNIKKKELLKL